MEPSVESCLLTQLIEVSLREWPVLNLAIDHGMGGDEAKDKVPWMANVIKDFMAENALFVCPEELNDYICEIVDNEFDTLTEDQSTDLMVMRILHFCKLTKENKETELQEILQKKKQQLSEEIARQTLAKEAAGYQRRRQLQPQDEPMDQDDQDDGWTVVKKK